MLFALNSSIGQTLFVVGFQEFKGEYAPVRREISYDDIDGSPYLDARLIKGLVNFRHGEDVVYFLRYDLYTDEIEYLQGGNLQVIQNQYTLEEIILDNHKIVYRDFFIKNLKHNGYLIQTNDSECRLYKKLRVEFQEAKPPESSYDNSTPAKFVSRPIQWFYAHEGEPIRLFTADNSGLKQFSGEFYSQLKLHIKKAKLKLKNEEDMVALFEHYNILLGQ